MIDIVIPTCGAWKNLALCLQAVKHFTVNEHRVIIVRNGPPASAEMRRVLDDAKRDCTVIELGDRCSFSKACNAGISAGSGKYVALLNDDVYVTDGWDATMIGELSNPVVGMVGARMNAAAAGLQGSPELSDTVRVPFLVFAHVMLRRDVIEKVGLLDAETFDGFGSEDLDYSWRVREAGYSLKVSAANSFHVGGVSMSHIHGGRGAEYARMHRRLVQKWTDGYVQRETRLYPRIALCVPTYNGKVDNDFFQSAMMLQKTGNFELEIYQTKRLVVHFARERITEAVMESNRFDYVWWLDDDMTFPSDTLLRLLAAKKPVVSAVAYQRLAPYRPCLFEWRDLPSHALKDLAPGAPRGQYEHIDEIEHQGLRRVDGCGAACCLVETEVFRKIAHKRPWFDNKAFGEDLHFSRLCNDAGIPIYADTDLIIGHIGNPVVIDEAHVLRYKAAKRQNEQQFAEVR